MSGTADLRNVSRRTVDAKTMSFRDSMDHVASAAQMVPGPLDAYLTEIDRAIAPFTPDGADASLDALEWQLVHKAFAAKQPATLIAQKIVHLRGWADDANDPLMVALRASVALTAIEKRVAAIEKQCDRIANFVQGLPQREEHLAVVADLEGLRDQLRGLSLRKAS